MANAKNKADQLVVIWSSADEAVFVELVFPYVLNSKNNHWFESVTLVVWGPSDETLMQSTRLQDFIEELLAAGVQVEACKACADNYGLAQKMQDLGIEVKYMGSPLTSYLKTEAKILTF